MDLTKRDALLGRINYSGNNDCFPAVVTLEEFFDGNDDLGSLWCNLSNPPESMTQVHMFLEMIRARADVTDLKILITQFDGSPDEWPFSDTVLIDTEVDPDDVATWFERYPPDEVEYGGHEVRRLSGFKDCVAVWWD
jgi:hypothetical protein